jgi:hypothetical protein
MLYPYRESKDEPPELESRELPLSQLGIQNVITQNALRREIPGAFWLPCIVTGSPTSPDWRKLKTDWTT